MLFVKHSDINWFTNTSHDMEAGVHNNLPANASADVIFARILPGHILPVHWHSRPIVCDGTDTGYEAFFFYEGGKIELIDKDGNITTYDLNEPFTLTFFSGENEAHGIKNIDDKPVTFHVLTAPKFDSIEEHFIEI